MLQGKNGGREEGVSEPNKSGSDTVISLAFPVERCLPQEDFFLA